MRSSIALTAVIAIACGAPSSPRKAVPSAVDAKIEAGRAHERARRYDLAEDAYRSAVAAASNPGDRARARRTLADALLFWGQYEQGATVLTALVADSPTNVPAWHDLGLVRERLGDTAGAELALGQSIQLSPRDPRSRVALAALLVNHRRLRAAQLEYRALLELELSPRLHRAVEKALDILARELGTPDTGR